MLITVLSSLAAGACFAAAGVVQQRVAATRPSEESLSFRLIIDLAQQPKWLAGIGLAVVSYFFQALALAFGPLAVVQPLVITELLFAIPVSARLQHSRLRAREWAGILGVAGGLAVAIAAADPAGGNPLPGATGWALVLPAVGGLAVVAVLVGRVVHGPVRASLFGFAAASALGTQAALLQSTTADFRGGPAAGFTSWHPYLMAVFSIVGLLLVQSAYQAGPLAASLPVIDAVEPTVAVVIGVAIFDEAIRTTPTALGLTAAGLLVLAAGIAVLDTSPVVHSLYQTQGTSDDPPSEEAAAPAGWQAAESG